MVSFADIYNAIVDTNDKLRQHKDEIDKLRHRSVNYRSAMTQDDINDIEQDIQQRSAENRKLLLSFKILVNNAKITLFRETMPIIVETLNCYAGKPYGEKTKKKINDEIRAKTGCNCHIRCSYATQSLEIYPINHSNCDISKYCNCNISVSVKDHNNLQPLLVENKIQEITVDEMELWYVSDEFVDNVSQRVDDILAVFEQMMKTKQKLETLCDKYNKLAVGDTRHFTANDRLNWNLIC